MIAIAGGPTKGNRALLNGLRRLGLDCSLVPGVGIRRLVQPGDVVINRLDVLPTLDGVEPGLLEVLWLERGPVRVVNTARALLAVHDKLRSSVALEEAGVAQPNFVHIRSTAELRALDLPIVVKPRFGAWGADVLQCRNERERSHCIEEVEARPWFHRHGALVQELLPPPGEDLRAIVAAGEIVGVAARSAAPGEWRTNVSLGGSLRQARLPRAAASLALAAARATGTELVGVDLLPARERGWLVLELNGAADFDERYSLPGRDVMVDIARALRLTQPTR